MELDKSKISGQFEAESLKVPDELPVLGLKDVVIFPQMVTALGVTADEELQLLDNVLATNRFVALVTHKNEEKDKLQPSDLYQYGTASVVLQMLRMPDNTAKMLVQGISRISLKQNLSLKQK
jgi:ATP-dependent Lon protease